MTPRDDDAFDHRLTNRSGRANHVCPRCEKGFVCPQLPCDLPLLVHCEDCNDAAQDLEARISLLSLDDLEELEQLGEL